MPKEKPLGVVVVEKIGWRHAIRGLTFLVAFGIASENVGHHVTMQEYTDYWGQSLATSYKERQSFGLIWPDAESNPEVVWERVKAQVKERKSKSVAAAQLFVVPW